MQAPAQPAAAPGKRAATGAEPQRVKGARPALRRPAPAAGVDAPHDRARGPLRLTPPRCAQSPRRAVVVYEELVDEFGFRYKRRRREPVPEARQAPQRLKAPCRRARL